MRLKGAIFIILFFMVRMDIFPQSVWLPDQGDGTYKNPVIYADYSDPDVIRVGKDYYMVASSFNSQPGIPVLHSKDLVNWTLVNHVYDRLPLQRYERMQPGQGSWAPAIRFHQGTFYVYFCTPEDGLFVATAKDPKGKWKLDLIQKVSNWEDPCPFWDTDGKAYLIHGLVGAGPAILHRMSADGKKLLDNGKIIYRDDKKQPVLEGFKFMDKRDGWYYFSAPAGGVSTGWQSVFRSKDIYGPYEDKIVLHQGKTLVNGPHQGGLVETDSGEWWFMHFQDKDAYGRIVHLQPVSWKDGWPIMGIDTDQDGIGEPVTSYKKPNIPVSLAPSGPEKSDQFSLFSLGLQWQWQAAPQKEWYSLKAKKGFMRLYAVNNPTDSGSLFYAPNLLLQKFAAPSFTASTRLLFRPSAIGDRAGLTVTGNSFTFLCLEMQDKGTSLLLYEGKRENRKYLIPKIKAALPLSSNEIWLKVEVDEHAKCRYSYSLDGQDYLRIGDEYQAEKGTWIGAKVGLVCMNSGLVTSKGYADFDFFNLEKQEQR